MATSSDKPPDLQKYNKLAAEYAKLRAQLPVLKRAVLEEQCKSTELANAVQQRDQSIRKLEQESDSLNFRNKQLEKRIGVLQNELQEVQVKNKGKKVKVEGVAQEVGSYNAQLDYELISKIEENMKLQQQLSDLEQSSNFEIETLKMQLESLNNEETHKELILNELSSIKSENQTLSFALQNSLDEIEAYKEQVDQMKEKIAVVVPVKPEVKAENINVNSSSFSGRSGSCEEDLEDSQELKPIDMVEKLKDSQKQKEYWSMEYQFLKMKYDRIMRKFEEAKEIIKGLGREDLLQLNTSEVSTPVIEPGNLIGRLEVMNLRGENVDPNSLSYENEVKEYMSKKVNELVSLLQLADSRAVHFYNECKAMQSVLSLSYVKTRDFREQLESCKSREIELNEELELTKDNYETQLTQLSEHLALMNEKITEKQELINELNAKLKAKK